MPSATANAGSRLSPDPERRRDDLLAAGAAVFAEVGVDAATVAAITSRAGTAKGNFYRYFSSKEALLAALRQQFIDDLLGEVVEMATLVGTEDWWALVDTFIGAIVDALLSRVDRLAIFYAEPSSPEIMQQFYDGEAQIEAVIVGGIEAGIEAGVFRVDDPAMTATILQHGVFSTVEHAALHGDPIDRDRLVGAACAIARRALGARD